MGLLTRTTRAGLLAVALGMGFLGAPEANAQGRSEVQQLLKEGHKRFQMGEYTEARRKFEEALALDVSSEEALSFIEAVGYAEIVRMVAAEKAGLAEQVGAIERILNQETRRRAKDEADIAAKLETYFSAQDMTVERKTQIEMVGQYGMYLLPGLVQRLASSEQATRVKSIIALRSIADDAVIPLCRVLAGSEDDRVILGAISALTAIHNPIAVASLKAVAENTSFSEEVRRSAQDAATKIDSGAAQKGAYELLVGLSRNFYLNSGFMTRSYHEPLVWTMSDSGLSHETCYGWRLNELRAGQFINDALTVAGDDAVEARVMAASNDLAQYAEYLAIRDVVAHKSAAGETVEIGEEELAGKQGEIERVRNRALASSNETLLGSVALALSDRQYDVAVQAIHAVRDGLALGQRFDSVPAVLTDAVAASHRGVRFAAAECIAYMNPTGSFAKAETVIPTLVEGLIQAGGRSALTAYSNEFRGLKIADTLKASNVTAVNVSGGWNAQARALSYPHDVLVFSTEIGDTSTADLIVQLRKDYRTQNVPIFVQVATEGEEAFLAAKAIYEKADNGVTVIPFGISGEAMRDDFLKPIFDAQDTIRSRSANIAVQASDALRFLATRDSQFDLDTVDSALSSAIADLSRPDSVRIPACEAAAGMGLSSESIQGALVGVCAEERVSDGLKEVVLRTLGQINRGNDSVSADVARVIEASATSDNPMIAKAASRAMGTIGIRPASMKN